MPNFNLVFLVLCFGSGPICLPLQGSPKGSPPPIEVCDKHRIFNPAIDGFAFFNETVFAHEDMPQDEAGAVEGEKYSRRCFVMVRAALQFFQHARFDETLPAPQSEQAILDKVKAITRRPLWLGPLPADKRVVIGGYANLHAFSKVHAALLQRNLGEGLPTYFRPANTRVAFPVLPAYQALAARQLQERLQRAQPPAVMITRFDQLNHALLVTSAATNPDGSISFSVYDPNLPGATPPLIFHPQRSYFSFGKTFYWSGGPVRVLRIYHSPLH